MWMSDCSSRLLSSQAVHVPTWRWMHCFYIPNLIDLMHISSPVILNTHCHVKIQAWKGEQAFFFFFPLFSSEHLRPHTLTHKCFPRDTCQPVSLLAQAGTSTPVWWGTAALPCLLTGGCGLATLSPLMTQVPLCLPLLPPFFFMARSQLLISSHCTTVFVRPEVQVLEHHDTVSHGTDCYLPPNSGISQCPAFKQQVERNW